MSDRSRDISTIRCYLCCDASRDSGLKSETRWNIIKFHVYHYHYASYFKFAFVMEN